MTPVVAALALFVLATAVAVFRISRLCLPVRIRLFLTGLRVVLLALLAAALLEPDFFIERFHSSRASGAAIPVLVDASLSMRGFSPDSVLRSVTGAIDRWQFAQGGKKQRFALYCFGDSLRRSAKGCTWSDRQSFLPDASAPVLRRAHSVILITDGNWSNTALQPEQYADKNLYYVPMKDAKPSPYLNISVPDFPKEAVVDSAFIVTISLKGLVRQNSTITITAMEKNTVLARRTVPATAGLYSQKATVSITLKTAGPHVLRFQAAESQNSLAENLSGVVTALPARPSYSFAGAGQTLDSRFIRIALEQQGFSESLPDRTPDLLVFFRWNQSTQTKMNKHGAATTVLFAGCLPCAGTAGTAGASMVSGDSLRIFRSPGYGALSPFDDCDPDRWPPVSRIFACRNSPLVSRSVLLSALPAAGTVRDTLEVLSAGRFNGHACVICAAEGIWRLDFLPLGVGQEAFRFSSRLVALTKDILRGSFSRQLLLCPSGTITESDSLTMRVIFPSHIATGDTMALLVSIQPSDSPGFPDTTVSVVNTGSGHDFIRLKPLPAKAYLIRAAPARDTGREQFSDSLIVSPDRSEYAFQDQNSSILQQIAQPVAGEAGLDSSTIQKIVDCDASMQRPVKEHITVRRSWPLLLLVFLVFAAEWIVRRKIRLD
ncbi:MAG: hypothetical protein MUF22_09465 [Chitinispirillaceae bacterium]|nr:hypothetical protein [Chitinispirillaceae bacterium]